MASGRADLQSGGRNGAEVCCVDLGARREAVCAVCVAYLWTMCGVTTRVARSESLSVSCMMIRRRLDRNQISSVEAGAFAKLSNLERL